MKYGLIIMTLLGAGSSFSATTNINRLNKNGVALCKDRDSSIDDQCYDAVSYLADHKAVAAGVDGAKKYRYLYQGATYVFSSQEHMDEFKKTPDRYLPQYGGWCAYAVAAKKDKVDIDPLSFHVQDGRLLLFYDGFFGDTKKTWLTDKKEDPAAYLKSADTNWPSVQNKEP